MSIDLDDIERRINNGIYGDDRMSVTERDDAFAALAILLAEVERLREMLLNAGWPREAEGIAELAQQAERAAVVAWLREHGDQRRAVLADRIERGEHVKAEP